MSTIQNAVQADAKVADVAMITNIISTFNLRNKTLWLIQVEAVFRIKRIMRSATKFYIYQANITPTVADKLRNILISPPTENTYKAYKRQY